MHNRGTELTCNSSSCEVMHTHTCTYIKKDHQSEPLIVVVNSRHVVISLCRLSHYISYQCTINLKCYAPYN